MKAPCVTDYRALARARLPILFFEYLDGGSFAKITLRRNLKDLERVALRQRVLKDVSQIDTSTTLTGNVSLKTLSPSSLANAVSSGRTPRPEASARSTDFM